MKNMRKIRRINQAMKHEGRHTKMTITRTERNDRGAKGVRQMFVDVYLLTVVTQ